MINKCPVCGNKNIYQFFTLSDMPVYSNILYSSSDEAKKSIRGDIHLGYCKTCDLIFNTAFDEEKLDYNQTYENSLHFSPRFQTYARELAQYLGNKYKLQNKTIIDIGCGKGDFLNMLCSYGNNRGIGFDPSIPDDYPTPSSQKEIVYVKDYFSPKYSNYLADLICSRHTLEHVSDPIFFLKSVRETIKKSSQSIIFFEVPNMKYILEKGFVWDIIYEHVLYFTPNSLQNAFKLAGFKVHHVDETFERQFLTIEAILANAKTVELPTQSSEIISILEKFSDNYDKLITFWQEKIERFGRDKLKAVIWGAGSKGITFLNTLQIDDQINYVVDINPRKEGKYIAGSGQQIVSPDFLQKYKPDAVIVMNSIYIQEIKEIIKKFDCDCQILVL